MESEIDNRLNLYGDDNPPGVINFEVLRRLIALQAPNGQSENILEDFEVKFEEVEEIRVEFLRILRIDYLWPFRNLVKLSLAQNLIEKISNLEALVELQELDLSFNLISHMENLNPLTKLEILILTSNKITAIENIDNLSMLTIFSIADNKLDTQDHVLYLRQLKNLRSFNVSGNPCTTGDNYFTYFVALLPQVIYFCYVMISESQRKEAQNEHRLAIRRVENAEEIAQTALEQQQMLEDKIALDSAAFVDQLDGNELFLRLLEHDKSGTAFKTFNDDSLSAFDDYQHNFSVICHDLHELGLQQYHERQEEVKEFSESIQDAQKNVRDDSRQIICTIMEYKKEIIAKFHNEIGDSSKSEDVNPEIDVKLTKFQSFTEDFDKFLSSKWIKLIHSEVILHDQIEDIHESFKINISDICNAFVESAKVAFKQMRLVAGEYRDTIQNLVGACLTDDNSLPEHLKKFFDDYEALNNALTASYDTHLQVIDSHEDAIVVKINFWLGDLIARFHKKEYDRHRRRVLEMSHFMQHEKDEMHNYLLANSPLGLDVVAALDD